MAWKKVLAAILALSVTAGISGCDNTEKQKKKIEELMDSYIDAFMSRDTEVILDLTDWDEDDKEFKEILSTFDWVEESMYDYEEYIYSTIEIDYDIDDLKFDEKVKKATLKFEYEIIDWKQAYYQTYTSFEEFTDALKAVKDTNTFDGKITFEMVGKEWKITKISKFSNMFEYADWLPDVRSEPVDPDFPAGPTPEDDYKKEITACLSVLSANEKSIKKAEQIYGKDFVNIYDMNADGHYEVMFVSADDVRDDYSSGSLHIYSYNQYAGECIEMITVPYVVYCEQIGGTFTVVITHGGIVITHSHGESDVLHVETDVYGLDFDLQRTYSRAVHADYDPETGEESVRYIYFEKRDGNYEEIGEDEYMASVKLLVENSIVIVGYNYLPTEDDVESSYNTLPDLCFHGFDDIYNSYLELVS